ncbi:MULTISPECIES: zinc ABC transporter substrate-binding protein [Clostridium]|uniref:Metal ABC transporter substrate-binding protein n=1 Tax=Clostridium cibarium TaxID=2762247 RepID=A0ABR8PXU2_9CLOT|nr:MULTISPECIES: zinc ABC transporter substrate-binding protein [Clostridium]MBD7912976.1 metal ABC transporter substrate-binding protein [Clostridium cibarium]
MKKLTFGMLFITFLLFLGLGTFSNPMIANTVDTTDAQRDLYLNIITCNKPQYEMVKSIVGDKHNVEYMFLTEKESKDFIFNDETINNISNMDLFFYSGNDFEPWSGKLINKLNKSNLGTIDISRGIRVIQQQTDNGNKENIYFYPGLEEYKIVLYNIKSAIQDKDPKNRTLYEENYNKVIENIDKKINKMKENKKDLAQYKFISLDDKLDYFYRGIGISPIKVTNNKTIESVIKDNKLDPTKVIVLKDRETPMTEVGYKVVTLDRYDGNSDVQDLIEKNYKSFYDLIELNENK